MRHWFRDAHFRSLLKNSSYLGISKIVAALAGVAMLAFAGRGLGVILFGTLILITSYAKAELPAVLLFELKRRSMCPCAPTRKPTASSSMVVRTL